MKYLKLFDGYFLESLDSPLNIWWFIDTDSKMIGRFETSKHFYMIEATKENKYAWSFKFYLTEHESKIFNTGGIKGIEAEKSSVLSTVISGFKEFIQRKNPEIVQFSSTLKDRTTQKESGRIKLYNSLSEKAAKLFGYLLIKTDTKESSLYSLYKPYIDKKYLEIAIDKYKRSHPKSKDT